MTFEKDAVVLEKNVRIANVMLALIALSAIGGVAGALFFHGPPLLLYLIGVPIGMHARITQENWRARRRDARVRAREDGVYVDDVRVVVLERVSHAIVQPRAGKKPTVRLRDKRRRIMFEVEVEDEAEGVAFLRAIGHDAAAKKAGFRTMSPLFSTQARATLALFAYLLVAIGILLTTFAILGFGGPTALFAFALALAPLFVALRGRDVEVGADGLSLTWNRRRRFIGFDEVRSVETPASDGVCVVLASGEKLHLRTGGGTGWGSDERRTLMREALKRRIVEAMEAHRARIGPRELAAQLAPGERDGKEWLEDLKKLRDGEGGYRAAAVREEDLWRVVEDPGAQEEARAAAAVLLRGTDGAAPRLRVAADAVASPRLRVALEAEEEEAAEEALKAYLRR